MRARNVTAIVALVLVGFAIKLFFFPAPPAEAEVRNSLIFRECTWVRIFQCRSFTTCPSFIPTRTDTANLTDIEAVTRSPRRRGRARSAAR